MAGGFPPRAGVDPLARARALLSRLAREEPFHARALAERLVPWWDAADTPLETMLSRRSGDDERAGLRRMLRERAELAVARGAAIASLEDLLRVERADAERHGRALDATIRALPPGVVDAADLFRHELIGFAGRIAAVLEPRIEAERGHDPGRAYVLHAQRDRWIGMARELAGRAMLAALSPHGITTAPQPAGPSLARRVVLTVAGDPTTLAQLCAMLEDAGATTILADSRPSALALLRSFRVDAVVAAITSERDACLDLPPAWSAEPRDAGAPLAVALLLGGAQAAPEVASRYGWDAAIPVSLADDGAFVGMMGAALAARRMGRTPRS